jgi:hypothetical protein
MEEKSKPEQIYKLDFVFSAFRQVDKYALRYGRGHGKEYREKGKPAKGWINLIRTTINFPVGLIAKKMGKKHAQSIIEFEKSEREETISIKNLREVGRTMGMELVYGFIPIGNADLKTVIRRKISNKVAKEFYQTPKELREPKHPKDISNNSAIAATERKMFYELPKSIWE